MAAATNSVVQPPPAKRPVATKLQRLALLYEGIFTAIVRVQAGRQQVQEVESFRTRMKQALREIAEMASRRGYDQEHVQHAHFAVVAFLDEAVLTSPDGAKTQWARKSLQEELFGQRSAGEVFFDRLEAFRGHRDSPELAEVLEVDYLCLLLGFEGKYAGSSKAELQLLMDNLSDRIKRILGRSAEFSADAALPDNPAPVITIDPLIRRLKWFVLAAALFALICFGSFWLHLQARSDAVKHAIQERVVP
jgi:type VI secretion system protein ImpK